MAHPYRPTPPVPERPPVEPRRDRACLVVFLVVWVTSTVRVANALRHDEPFGFEPALALGVTVLAPLAVAASAKGEDSTKRRGSARPRGQRFAFEDTPLVTRSRVVPPQARSEVTDDGPGRVRDDDAHARRAG